MSNTYRKHDIEWKDLIVGWGRDKKPFYKPDKKYKYMTKRIRRSKEKQALREGKEMPIFKHTDMYDWN